ncbi:carnitine dehydratase [Mycobacterium sp. CBMA 234]|uniref:CaiB/BaiF CoA transferase family protein n=1 Tax=Mycolicibacterium sp. CBMA 234 TaxID=1918495 RepID=UPI0012DDB444|nr:CaiB/BaiF CoA-transferase family protein [Mycolicibacterium sp. CBMA 234]MUL67124.1 carnitine dehydratase [Mycolicibacterium sp. CBMA 234]
MGPLSGIRVIELAGLAPAPFGCMILADLGADVLRIERANNGGDTVVPANGPLDRGKVSLSLDLKNHADKEALIALVRQADVFVEGFRPGVTERLGIGPNDLLAHNDRLIYGRMTGWGQSGPLAHTAGHDINYIALSGALGLIGPADSKPVPPVNLLGDFGGGGMLLALGVLAALCERHRSGQGQVIDAAMVDGAALCTTFMHGLHAVGQWNQPRGRNVLDGAAPFYQVYECADGRYVAVGCVEPQFFRQLLNVLDIDHQDLPPQMDAARWEELSAVIAAKFQTRSRDEWADVFAATDACVTPVLDPWETHDHSHHRDRQSFIDIAGHRQPAPAPRFSRTPAAHPEGMRADIDAIGKLFERWGISGDPLAN